MDKRLLLTLFALVFVAQIGFVLCAPRVKDYYELLGIQQDATAKEIKKSYFKVAIKYHPDKNPDVEDRSRLETHFGKLSHAYQVLSSAKLREKYDKLLKKGIKEYTNDAIKADEEREASGTQYRSSSYDVFDEVERMTDEELQQMKKEKATLLAMGLGIIGIAVYFGLKNNKIRKMFGLSPTTGSTLVNVNASKSAQQAIAKENTRILDELEKQRLKEEKMQRHAEKVVEHVQKLREAMAAEEMEREAAIQEEKEKQKQILQARREAALAGEGVVDENEDDEGFAEEHNMDHELNGVVVQKTSKSADFHCKPCKKSFKSNEQLENHFESKKHKQALKDAEKLAKKKGNAP